MTIWILSRGEHCEGSRIIGVYATRESALAVVPTIECHFDGGWIQNEMIPLFWDNECDYLMICEHEVIA